MIFVDASAMVAILFRESDWKALSETIAGSKEPMTSPLAVWETVIALASRKTRSFEDAERAVQELMSDLAIRIVPVDAQTGRFALEASRRVGRGRHPASLNFGDCFAYAAARQHGAALLFKGDDFGQTDIRTA